MPAGSTDLWYVGADIAVELLPSSYCRRVVAVEGRRDGRRSAERTMAAYGAGKAFSPILTEALWFESRGTGLQVAGLSPVRRKPSSSTSRAIAHQMTRPFHNADPTDSWSAARGCAAPSSIRFCSSTSHTAYRRRHLATSMSTPGGCGTARWLARRGPRVALLLLWAGLLAYRAGGHHPPGTDAQQCGTLAGGAIRSRWTYAD